MMQRNNKTKTPKEPVITHEQWIEIRRRGGRTITTFYPPNAEFEKMRQEMDPQPTLIYRRLNFVQGVPDEYRWTVQVGETPMYGGHFLTRMKVEDWLRVMEAERNAGNLHAFPCADPQQRPREFGPCPCAFCAHQRGEDIP